MKSAKIFACLLPLLVATPASAKLFQIIHTNDLHSYFNGTRAGSGGYARIRTIVDKLKADAKAKGMETLYLDGGDFGEGSSYFFSNQGTDSLRALDQLGVDATVLGNHDYILGGTALRRQIEDAHLKTPILSANLIGKQFMGLSKHIPDSLDFLLDGMKIRVFGLTTQEIHFQYPLRPLGFIAPSHNVGIIQAEKAEKEGVDFLIALTHTGVNKDILLARNTFSVGLVVGGHDHFLLKEPEMVENLQGHLVPVVQAGAHGGIVGQIIMDINKGGKSSLVDYQQYQIDETVERHPAVHEFVGEAYMNREQYFGRQWDEVIGHSEIILNGNVNGVDQNNKSCWSRHMARLMRKAAKTDLSMQFDIFQGEQINPGPITFGDMVDNFPHFRRWGDKGWSVARAWVNGWMLKKVINFLNNSNASFISMTVDGLQALEKGRGLVKYNPEKHRTFQARVRGLPIRNLKFYSLAFPSEVPYGMMKTTGLSTYILRNMKYVDGTSFWPMLEDYIRENSPLTCIDEE